MEKTKITADEVLIHTRVGVKSVVVNSDRFRLVTVGNLTLFAEDVSPNGHAKMAWETNEDKQPIQYAKTYGPDGSYGTNPVIKNTAWALTTKRPWEEIVSIAINAGPGAYTMPMTGVPLLPGTCMSVLRGFWVFAPVGNDYLSSPYVQRGRTFHELAKTAYFAIPVIEIDDDRRPRFFSVMKSGISGSRPEVYEQPVDFVEKLVQDKHKYKHQNNRLAVTADWSGETSILLFQAGAFWLAFTSHIEGADRKRAPGKLEWISNMQVKGHQYTSVATPVSEPDIIVECGSERFTYSCRSVIIPEHPQFRGLRLSMQMVAFYSATFSSQSVAVMVTNPNGTPKVKVTGDFTPSAAILERWRKTVAKGVVRVPSPHTNCVTIDAAVEVANENGDVISRCYAASPRVMKVKQDTGPRSDGVADRTELCERVVNAISGEAVSPGRSESSVVVPVISKDDDRVLALVAKHLDEIRSCVRQAIDEAMADIRGAVAKKKPARKTTTAKPKKVTMCAKPWPVAGLERVGQPGIYRLARGYQCINDRGQIVVNAVNPFAHIQGVPRHPGKYWLVDNAGNVLDDIVRVERVPKAKPTTRKPAPHKAA